MFRQHTRTMNRKTTHGSRTHERLQRETLTLGTSPFVVIKVDDRVVILLICGASRATPLYQLHIMRFGNTSVIFAYTRFPTCARFVGGHLTTVSQALRCNNSQSQILQRNLYGGLRQVITPTIIYSPRRWAVWTI